MSSFSCTPVFCPIVQFKQNSSKPLTYLCNKVFVWYLLMHTSCILLKVTQRAAYMYVLKIYCFFFNFTLIFKILLAYFLQNYTYIDYLSRFACKKTNDVIPFTCIESICLRRRHRQLMQRTDMATGGAQSTLGETELKVIATGVGATSDKTEVSEATASVGPYSAPARIWLCENLLFTKKLHNYQRI